MFRDMFRTAISIARMLSTRDGRAEFHLMRNDPDKWMEEALRQFTENPDNTKEQHE